MEHFLKCCFKDLNGTLYLSVLKYLFIGMKFYDTDLWKYLKKDDVLSIGIDERFAIAEKFLQEMDRIEKANVLHSDIKPSNILMNLDENGKWNGDLVVTDFGIACNKKTWSNKKRGGTSGWADTGQFSKFAPDDVFARVQNRQKP